MRLVPPTLPAARLLWLACTAVLGLPTHAQTDVADTAAPATSSPQGTVWTRRSTVVLPEHLLAQSAGSAARQLIVLGSDGHTAIELGAGRVTKGAPYCADTVRESVQTLSDGNRIVQSTSGRLCRDSEGRTRQESERDGRRQVWLHDPVTQEAWALDPQRKTARLFTLKSAPLPPLSPLAGLPAASAAGGARAVTVVTETVRRRDAQGRETEQVGVRVTQVDPPMPPTPPVPPLPGPLMLSSTSLAPRGPGVETALPGREIDGVKASGVRTTWTIEAGKLGNEKPIVITREVWTSPDLALTLLSRDHDPRSGETSYRLTNLKRGEPDAALMRVPSDHEVQRNPVIPRPPVPPVPPSPKG